MPGCAMGNCRNYSSKSKGQGIIYHSFPRDPRRQKLWVLKCRRKDKINVRTASVCSDHFSPDDYERDLKAELMGSKPRKVLKPTAVPETKPFPDPIIPISTPRRLGSTLMFRSLRIPPAKRKSQAENSAVGKRSHPLILPAPPKVVTKPFVITLSNNTICKLPFKKMLKSRAEATLKLSENNTASSITLEKGVDSVELINNESALGSSSHKKDSHCMPIESSDLSAPSNISSIKDSTVDYSSDKNDSCSTSAESSSLSAPSNLNSEDGLTLESSSSKNSTCSVSVESRVMPAVPVVISSKESAISTEPHGKDSVLNSSAIKATQVPVQNADPGDGFTVSHDQVLLLTYASPNYVKETTPPNYVKNPTVNYVKEPRKIVHAKVKTRKTPLPPEQPIIDLDKVINSTILNSDCNSPSKNNPVTTTTAKDENKAAGSLKTKSTESIAAHNQILEELFNDYRKKRYSHRSTQTIVDKYGPVSLLKRIKSLKRSVQTLKDTVKKRDDRIKQLRQLVATTKKSVDSKVHQILGKLFSPSQIRCIISGKNCKHWNVETVEKALALRTISKKAYLFLKNSMGFPFPGISTLKRWIRLKKVIKGEQKSNNLSVYEMPKSLPVAESLETMSVYEMPESPPVVQSLETNSEFREFTIEITTSTE